MAIADVNAAYQVIGQPQRQQLSQQVTLRFSNSATTVANAVDSKVMTQAYNSLANRVSQEAVKLRDQGDDAAASSLLQSFGVQLRGVVSSVPSYSTDDDSSRALMEIAEELDEEALIDSSSAEWLRERKTLNAKQHRKATQQNY